MNFYDFFFLNHYTIMNTKKKKNPTNVISYGVLCSIKEKKSS